jgi:hypothetical protein
MDPLLMGGILGDLTSRGCSGAGQADPGHRVARRASSMSRSDWHPAGESAMMAISPPLSLSLLGTSTWRAQAKRPSARSSGGLHVANGDVNFLAPTAVPPTLLARADEVIE